MMLVKWLENDWQCALLINGESSGSLSGWTPGPVAPVTRPANHSHTADGGHRDFGIFRLTHSLEGSSSALLEVWRKADECSLHLKLDIWM